MRIRAWAIGMVAALACGVGVAQGPVPSAPSSQAPTDRSAAPAAAAPTGAAELTAADATAWVDGFIPYGLRSADIPGAVVMIVKDGKVLVAKGYGYADIAKRKPVDPATTLFRPGSVSKLVTWTAVMQQVEAGKIDLDADVNTYLDFKIPPRDGGPVTMRQLMTHTGGFEETVKDLISFDPKAAQPLGAYLKRWTPKRIFPAGHTPAYSNWGTSLAGYIVERVSGMPFDDYLDRRIFAPLDMRTATFRQPLPARLKPLMATGYPRASEKPEPFEIVVPAPAGSLSASGLDMAKFMIAHLQSGRGVLKPETAATMHDSPLDKIDPMTVIPPLNRMELGFFETNVNGREVIAHLGDTTNFHTSLHLFEADGVGLYVSFNSAGKEGAVQALRLQLFTQFADRYFPGQEPNGKVDPKVAAGHARLMAGKYAASRRSQSGFLDILNLFGQTAVGVDDDGGLMVPALHTPGGGVQKWDEIAPFVWHDRYGHDLLGAKVIDGKVARWSFGLPAPFTVFEPVPAYRSSTWILPALYAALGILLLTALYWPGTWWLRRRYATPLKVTGNARRAYRATHLMAWATLAILGGWAWFITSAFSNLETFSASSDGLLWLLQIAGAIIFVGGFAIAVWNAMLTWRAGARWTARLWSVLVVLATALVLYVAVTFGLIAMTVNY